jgi:endonuclease/exonuclease/phosphatase family metal-dependent hydrolase
VSTLRILSYNICRGGGGKEALLSAAIADARPDIVVFQEATDPAVIERLAGAAGMAQWASRRGESLGFMSRNTVRHFAWHRPRFSRHAFIEIDPGPNELRIFGVHLSALYSAWTERRRVFELRALLASIARHQHGFHVLAGDFNTLAPGDLLDFRKLPNRLRALVWLSGGRIQWRTIQLILDAGYADGYRTLHAGDPGYTFPTWAPHVRLDYVFVPTAFAGRLQSCEILKGPAAAAASDHFPFLAEVTPTPGST